MFLWWTRYLWIPNTFLSFKKSEISENIKNCEETFSYIEYAFGIFVYKFSLLFHCPLYFII